MPARSAILSTLTFPNLQGDDKSGVLDKNMIPWGALDRVLEGVLVNSLSNLRFSMVQEQKVLTILIDASVKLINFGNNRLFLKKPLAPCHEGLRFISR